MSSIQPLKEKTAWQQALSNLITDPKELLALLDLDPALLEAAYAAARQFPLKVPRNYLARIEKNNLHDPLLKQILPLGIELNQEAGYSQDPLQEVKANPRPGLLHKYSSRVLITLSSACAVHCRYCFRRHFPYQDNNPGTSGWQHLLDYIKQDESINEVILSGGDPLTVSDKLLKSFSDQLSLIPHLKRLRLHTRLPIVLPERISDEFLAWISQVSLQTVMVVHVNHANEISDEVKQAMLKLRQAGITLLNQAVLLRGVNDDVVVLTNLSEALFAAGVLPYYLHTLDKVEGAAHFDLALEQAQTLHAELMKKLPGYLLPKLVCEQAGQASKTWLSTGL
jgi:EF-P beta-lysylation protein EpmB